MPNGSDKIYIGQRPADKEIGDCHVWVERRGKAYPLKHVVVHSPTGFEWGYGGSGPADTALSILADYFGESPKVAQGRLGVRSRAYELHQDFKWALIAPAPREGFRITSQEITSWLNAFQRARVDARKEKDTDEENHPS